MKMEKVLKHISASSLNTAKADMALWGIQYLENVRGMMSVQAARGIATEEGTALGLKDLSLPIEDCVDAAVEHYNAKTALTPQGGDARDRQREVLAGYSTSRTEYPGTVRVALEALRPLGVPTGHGEKILVELEGIPVPCLGFKDFSFDQHGFSVDLKSTERMPNEITPDHRLQLAIYYIASGNQAQRVAYCSPKEATIFELSSDAARLAIKEATHVARILKERLEAADTPQDFIRSQVPDYTSFRWHDAAREKAAELIGY